MLNDKAWEEWAQSKKMWKYNIEGLSGAKFVNLSLRGQFVKTNYGRVGGQNLFLGSIVQILLILNQFKYIEWGTASLLP